MKFVSEITHGDRRPWASTYDADGNMTCDGRFRYTWNGENRLVRAQELVAPTNRHPYTVSYAYDHRGRMVSKRITENDGQDTLVKSIAYLWDGWNIIREIQVSGVRDQGAGETLVTDNVWGLDPVDESFSILLLNFLSILHSTQFVRQHPFFSAKYAFVLNNCNLVDVLGEQPRDKYYGLPERFWHWYHKNVKQNGDPDLTKEEAHDEYDNLVKQGKPGADSKDNRGKDSSNKNPGKECEPIETEDDERNEEDDIPHEQNFKSDSQTVDGKQIANLIVISIISAFISYLLYSAGFAPL